MTTHEALRHEPAVGRTKHVRCVHPLGIDYARQPVEKLGRGGHGRVAWRDDPVVLLEGRNPRETGLADHRTARQEKERLITLSAGEVVPAHPLDRGVLERVCSPEPS